MREETRPHAGNRLLAALPRGDYERIAPHWEPVELSNGQVLYHRGRITILDREGLEGFSYECYPVIKAEFDRPAS